MTDSHYVGMERTVPEYHVAVLVGPTGKENYETDLQLWATLDKTHFL
jgi:hypothetical protein